MQRIQSTRHLMVLKTALAPKEALELDVLRKATDAMIKASLSFQKLTNLVGNPQRCPLSLQEGRPACLCLESQIQ